MIVNVTYEVYVDQGVSDVLEFDTQEEAEKAARQWAEETRKPICIERVERMVVSRILRP